MLYFTIMFQGSKTTTKVIIFRVNRSMHHETLGINHHFQLEKESILSDNLRNKVESPEAKLIQKIRQPNT